MRAFPKLDCEKGEHEEERDRRKWSPRSCSLVLLIHLSMFHCCFIPFSLSWLCCVFTQPFEVQQIWSQLKGNLRSAEWLLNQVRYGIDVSVCLVFWHSMQKSNPGCCLSNQHIRHWLLHLQGPGMLTAKFQYNCRRCE